MRNRQPFEFECDAEGFQSLLEKHFVVCFNPQEENERRLSFLCCACNKSITGYNECFKHCNQGKHYRDVCNKRHRQQLFTCRKCHTPQQMSHLSNFLRTNINGDDRLSEADHVIRKSICAELTRLLEETGVKGVQVDLYGSSCTLMGYKGSDANIDIRLDDFNDLEKKLEVTDSSSLFWFAVQTIQKSDLYTSFKEVFTRKYPELGFTHKKSGVTCVIKLHTKNLLRSHDLILKYLSADERVCDLYMTMRLWCQRIGVCERESGGIPSFNLMLLVLYYLQNVTPPVIPVIKVGDVSDQLPKKVIIDQAREDLFTITEDEASLWKSENKSCLGELWLGLLRFYAAEFSRKSLTINIRQKTPLSRSAKEWSSHRFGIEDPFNVRDNISKYAANAVLGYLLDSLEISYRYFTSYCRHKDELKDSKSEGKSDKGGKEAKADSKQQTIDNAKKEVVKEGRKEISDNGADKSPVREIENKQTVESDDDNDDVIIESESEEGSGGEKEEGEGEQSASDQYKTESTDDTDSEYIKISEDLSRYKEESYVDVAKEILPQDAGDTSRLSESERVRAIRDAMMSSEDTDETGDSGQTVGEQDPLPGDASSNVQLSSSEESGENNDVPSDLSGILQNSCSEKSDDNVPRDDCGIAQSSPSGESKENNDVPCDLSGILQNSCSEKNDDNVPRDDCGIAQSSPSGESKGNNDVPRVASGTVQPSLSGNSDVNSNKERISKVQKESTGSAVSKQERSLVTETGIDGVSNGLVDFQLDKKNLRPKYSVPLYCRECNQDGHIAAKCPLTNFIVKDLPSMTKEWRQLLDKVCRHVIEKKELKPEEFEIRMNILSFLEQYLKEHYRDDCRLVLFGSSVNGFGFSGSDMDVCLQFAGHTQAPENVDAVDVIKRVKSCLEKNQVCHKVYAIYAKVPIVKFCVYADKHEFESDISFYNTLAIRNSSMLSTYAMIDGRVRTLGYCLKVFAKTCEIGDASRGSLSSYAYILLLLYYLQNCKPPVLPVLQELYKKDKRKPKRMVEGCNTWYFEDVDSLHKFWSGQNKNKQSAGELFLGFFRFYVEEFDFTKQVVAMKQTKPLYKYEKSWNSASIAIEDPFLLKHNLGAGIQKNMFYYIKQCFANARLHFGDCKRAIPSKTTAALRDHFFSAKLLVGNERVPQNRLCHKCGRIGHIASNCAEKQAMERDRKRNNSETETPKKPTADTEDQTICFNCREVGHKKADCPVKEQVNHREGPYMAKCFKCNEFGHKKSECTSNRRSRYNRRAKGKNQDELPRKEKELNNVVKPQMKESDLNLISPTVHGHSDVSATRDLPHPKVQDTMEQMSYDQINDMFKLLQTQQNEGVFPTNTPFVPPMNVPLVSNAPILSKNKPDGASDFDFSIFAKDFDASNKKEVIGRQQPSQNNEHRQSPQRNKQRHLEQIQIQQQLQQSPQHIEQQIRQQLQQSPQQIQQQLQHYIQQSPQQIQQHLQHQLQQSPQQVQQQIQHQFQQSPKQIQQHLQHQLQQSPQQVQQHLNPFQIPLQVPVQQIQPQRLSQSPRQPPPRHGLYDDEFPNLLGQPMPIVRNNDLPSQPAQDVSTSFR